MVAWSVAWLILVLWYMSSPADSFTLAVTDLSAEKSILVSLQPVDPLLLAAEACAAPGFSSNASRFSVWPEITALTAGTAPERSAATEPDSALPLTLMLSGWSVRRFPL